MTTFSKYRREFVACNIESLALFCCWAIAYQETMRAIDAEYLRQVAPLRNLRTEVLT